MRRPSGGLWGHRDFLKLWTGQSITELGSQVSGLAIPLLAAYSLHATPLQFSLLGVIGLPALHPLRAPRRCLGGPAAPALHPDRRRRGTRGAARDRPDPVGTPRATGVATPGHRVHGRRSSRSSSTSRTSRTCLPWSSARISIDGNSKLQLTASDRRGQRAAAGRGADGRRSAPLTRSSPTAASFVVSTRLHGLDATPRGPRRSSRPARSTRRCGRRSRRASTGSSAIRGSGRLRCCTGTSNFFSTLSNAILILYMAEDVGLPEVRDRDRLRGDAGRLDRGRARGRTGSTRGSESATRSWRPPRSPRSRDSAIRLRPAVLPTARDHGRRQRSSASARSPTTSRRSACARRSRPSGCRAA